MFSEYANEYREWAEHCLALAERAAHPEAKTAWLELARKWQRVAEQADTQVRLAREIRARRQA